jgi:hypothetical protein
MSMTEQDFRNPRENFGVRGKSLLFQLNHGEFDICKQMLPEAMHLAYSGVVKLMLTMCVNFVGTSRSNVRRTAPSKFSDSLLKIKVPSEVRHEFTM